MNAQQHGLPIFPLENKVVPVCNHPTIRGEKKVSTSIKQPWQEGWFILSVQFSLKCESSQVFICLLSHALQLSSYSDNTQLGYGENSVCIV